MPVTKTATIAYLLTSINLDMVATEMTCGFTRQIDGVVDSTMSFKISGTDLQGLFATQATAGQPLGDEITVAIYNYVVGKGLINGAVS